MTERDMDPERAAQAAVEELDDGHHNEGDTSGRFPGMDGAEGPMQRLFDGNAPGPSVPEIQADYNLPHWLALMTRGAVRVATGDGIPPIVEIVGGGVLGVQQKQSENAEESTDTGGDVDEIDPTQGGSQR